MVADIIRDSPFGHIVRLMTRNKVFQYPEEKDQSVAIRYYNTEKTRNMARYGSTSVPEDKQNKEKENIDGEPTQASAQHQGSTADAPDNGATEQAEAPPHHRSTGSITSGDTRVDMQRQVSNVTGTPVDSERGRDLTVVDWDGPDDPENPLNWSTAKKFFVTFEICLLTLGVYIGSAIYTAGIEDIIATFHVSQVAATVGLTLFVAGYGLGPMLWSPMSEIPQVGRSPIYMVTLLVFVVFQVPTALASNFGMLLAFRFLTGLFGSPVLATGGATLSDIYPPKKRAYAISIWGMAAVCGPTLGPLVGGFAAESKGWEWTIWELTWLSAFAFILLFFLLPETSSANILYRKTRRLRKLTGNENLICEPELMGESMTGKDIVMMVLVRPITLNFQEPMVFLLNLYIALIYGLLYIWFESFPIVFVQIYGFSLGLEGTAFLGIMVGAILTIPFYFAYLYYYQEPKFDDAGNIQPEQRLPPAFFGAFCIPICLFWFGWSAGHTHWIMPIIGSGFFSIGAFCLFNAV